ncbi:type I methionyl aminopeptidase [Paenactinomyces guangxiensis]|uniref:Methionine aminopeptidase n=1 Tax=Paenactinomyces guangxiensis TaxID=1490290 RepID=A0A7W1WUM5_9BACL|nr:type I methionyl aminopeptidase [Paenactinomyces guangxiensis]MBA4496288.1 type I methionyl aminopeptidase [Paenactinomyces guangxiensis]MBH8593341.1 type I methionyl aminopeptidase [Paenactinomyces guangxiensis]
MISIKSTDEIEKIRQAGQLLASCHRHLARIIRPGISTLEIDQWVEEYLEKHGATPEQKGYMGYPYATCASVNDEVCHGFPRKTPLNEGDIVTVDMVVNLDGWLADSAWSYPVGKISPEVQKLLDITKASLYQGIARAKAGNRIGDISHAIQTYAESRGLSVVRPFIGHGIGRRIHEPPEVPHFGPPGRGPLLREGMVITIEPMLNLGNHHVKIEPDGWTAKTVDGSWSAQYEHTVAITAEEPLILTEQEGS